MQHAQSIIDAMIRKGTALLDLDGSLGAMIDYFKPYGIKNNEKNREMFCSLFLNSPICPVISGVIIDATSLFHISPEKEATNFLTKLQYRGIIPIGSFNINKISAEPLADSASVPSLITRGITCIKLNMFLAPPFNKDEIIVAFHIMVPIILEAQKMDMAVICEFCIDETQQYISKSDVHDLIRETLKTFKTIKHYDKINMESIIIVIPVITAGSAITSRPSSKDVAHDTLDIIKCHIPKQVPGVFVSTSGLISEEALLLVGSIIKANDSGKFVTGIFGKTILNTPLSLWKGNDNLIDDARELFSETLLHIQDFFE